MSDTQPPKAAAPGSGIDSLTLSESHEFLHAIADQLGIGIGARDKYVIMANIANAARRSECLWEVETCHTVTLQDDDGEEYEEAGLLWGESREAYGARYRAIYEALSADAAELKEIKDFLWPDQTGLPNEHRNALVAIKARERLLKDQIPSLNNQDHGAPRTAATPDQD